MGKNVTQKLIESHLLSGKMKPGVEIALMIDQTLTQDATGTMVMLELEALNLDRVKTQISAQYVDHNLLQGDHKNADDHLFLQSACRRFGIWFSRAGNGVSHPLHMQRFGKPGASMIGSDSHTCAAGCIGMLAIGTGGIDVALAMAGEPYYVTMPEILGIRLEGRLREWVSAKDVILEMLRRRGVKGGVGRIIEYYGPGLRSLSVWDRHVIANMGAELGATTTIFPSDEATRIFLEREGRADDWLSIAADRECGYDVHEELNLSEIEPLIAKPSSPGNVVPVRDAAGEMIHQAYIGSSANPGFRDFAIAAEIVKGKTIAEHVSFDINPTSRGILQDLLKHGFLASLLKAGARLHQAGCNGCIGMGQAPATGRNSLRTVPRNFPGRSGTKEDHVWLCSPETAAASAIKGVITDPRDLKMKYPRIQDLENPTHSDELFTAPVDSVSARDTKLEKGPNIASLPEFGEFPDSLELPILLKVGDNISTDEIMPAGSRVLPYRSNIEKISEFCFDILDETYSKRAVSLRDSGGHAIVGGANYGQGSSREHAALAPRFLGLRVVIARSFARIHRQNLINFGILPLVFEQEADYDRIEQHAVILLDDIRGKLRSPHEFEIEIRNGNSTRICVRASLSPRQTDILLAGGIINWRRRRQTVEPDVNPD